MKCDESAIVIEPVRDAKWMADFSRDMIPAICDDLFKIGRLQGWFESLLNNDENLFLAVKINGERVGFFALASLGGGKYQAHNMMGPQCRGAIALTATRKAIDVMFDRYGAVALVGSIPDFLPAASLVARRMGFRDIGETEGGFIKGGVAHNVKHLALFKDDWMRKKEAELCR